MTEAVPLTPGDIQYFRSLGIAQEKIDESFRKGELVIDVERAKIYERPRK
jgi:hypothetical protein